MNKKSLMNSKRNNIRTQQTISGKVLKGIPIIIALVGAVLIASAVATDWIRLGTSGFGMKQCLLVSVGFVVLLFGVSLSIIASNRTIWQLTETKLWRVFSLLLFFMSILGLGGMVFLIIGPELVYQTPLDSQFLTAQDTATVSKVSIPVRFLPDYNIEYLPDGTYRKTLKWGEGDIETTSDKVALILVDCWESEELTGQYKNIAALLDKARAHGVTIIHAPNHPVVDKYPQYHALHREVNSFLQPSLPEKVVYSVCYPLTKQYEMITKWSPPPEFRREVQEMRHDAYTRHYMGHPPSERDICRFLRPMENEFIVESSEELRYVLWLKKINLLLYVGGATNQCILHRPTGVLNLVGSNYVIVLLGDCTVSSCSPWCDNEVVQKVFEDYYMRNIGYVANSSEITWQSG